MHHSEYRNQGIATSLLQQAIAFSDKAGFSNTSLYTNILIPAHRIYERHGFRDIEKVTRYVKYLDYDFVFRRWVRWCNHYLKHSNIVKRRFKTGTVRLFLIWEAKALRHSASETVVFKG